MSSIKKVTVRVHAEDHTMQVHMQVADGLCDSQFLYMSIEDVEDVEHCIIDIPVDTMTCSLSPEQCVTFTQFVHDILTCGTDCPFPSIDSLNVCMAMLYLGDYLQSEFILDNVGRIVADKWFNDTTNSIFKDTKLLCKLLQIPPANNSSQATLSKFFTLCEPLHLSYTVTF